MTLGDDRYSERPWGERLREWREKTKQWTRPELAEQIEALSYKLKEARGHRIDTRLISRWEKGEIKRPQSVYLRILAQLGAPTHPDAVHDSSAASLERVDDDEMKRRLFLRSAGAAVAAAVVFPGESYGGRAVLAKVDPGTIRAIRASVDDLYIRDQAVGGATLARRALAQYYDARHMLDESDYSEEVGSDLMSAAGELAVCVGWLSYDAGNQNDARRLYNEAFVLADQAGDGLLAIQAIEKMAQQSTFIAGHGRHKGAAREALRLGARLTDLARTESSSRLHALVASRQAIAFAASGSESDFRSSIRRSWREIEHADASADSETWLEFVTPAEVMAQEAIGYRHLGNLGKAVELNHESLSDTSKSPRNRAVCQANLAGILADMGDLSGAVEEGNVALRALEHVQAPRVVYALDSVRDIAHRRGDDEFCTRYDRLFGGLRVGT